MPKRSRLNRNGSSMKKKSRMEKDFYEKPVLAESEIRLLKDRMNRGKLNAFDVLNRMPEDGWKITSAQMHKGFDWLMNRWKSPKTGAERKNNPFGYREQEILKNFKEFRLVSFRDTANVYQTQMGIHWYLPVYDVIAKDGSSFQYHIDNTAGGVSIVG